MEPDSTEASRQDHDSGPDRPEPEPFDGKGTDQGPGRFVVHDPYTVHRDPNFRHLVLAGMVATVGNQMQGVAIGWELYERTSSPLALGMVGLAQALPVILLAIPAGHAANRYSRKWLIILAHGLLLLATVGLALLSAWRGPVGLTYLFLVVTGAAQALNRPARWAILPKVVPRELLLSAVTWNTSAWQVAAMAGPALGGAGHRLGRRCHNLLGAQRRLLGSRDRSDRFLAASCRTARFPARPPALASGRASFRILHRFDPSLDSHAQKKA
jgi:Transmembrane secretion effector